MEAEQDQNTEAISAQLTEGMIRDLRRVIYAGINLDQRHCRKLLVFPYLERVLASASNDPVRDRRATTPLGEKPPVPSAYSVHNAVRKAIQRAKAVSIAQDNVRSNDKTSMAVLDDPEDAEHYFEVRMRLFGFSPRTPSKGPGDRRQKALDYYNEHLNHKRRRFPAKPDNFRSRISDNELLPPIAEQLFSHEVELREQQQNTLAGVTASAVEIGTMWTETYWWYFRLGGLLQQVAWNAEYFIRVRDGLSLRDMVPIPPAIIFDREYEPRVHTEKRYAHFYLKYALYYVAIIWRFIRYEGWPQDWAESGEFRTIHFDPKILLSDLLTEFQSMFAFTPPEEDWVDLTLDRVTHDPERSANSGSAFIDALDAEPYGRVVYSRFAALTDTCRCLVDATADRCMFHTLGAHAKTLNDLIQLGWLRLAQTQTDWRDPDNIPPVASYVD